MQRLEEQLQGIVRRDIGRFGERLSGWVVCIHCFCNGGLLLHGAFVFARKTDDTVVSIKAKKKSGHHAPPPAFITPSLDRQVLYSKAGSQILAVTSGVAVPLGSTSVRFEVLVAVDTFPNRLPPTQPQPTQNPLPDTKRWIRLSYRACGGIELVCTVIRDHGTWGHNKVSLTSFRFVN